MDPVSTAIVAGLAAGVAKGVGEVSQKLIVDAYQALKGALQQKFGLDSALVKAVDLAEGSATPEAYQAVVEAEVKQKQADEDPEVRAAAEKLLAALKATAEGQQALSKYQINVQGDVGIIGDQTKIEGGFRVGGSKGDG